jgi:hypothetical protein
MLDKLKAFFLEKILDKLLTTLEAALCAAIAGAGTGLLDYLNDSGNAFNLQHMEHVALAGFIAGFALYFKTPRGK